MNRSHSPLLVVVAAGLLISSVSSCSGCKKLLKKGVDAGIDAADVPAEAAAPVVDASVEAAAPEQTTAADAGPAQTGSGHTAAADPGAVGTFSGQVKEGSLSYPMTAVLNDKGGSISYGLPFNCKGTWTLTNHTGKVWHFKEHISEQGGRKCAQGETATLDEVKPGVFTYSEGSAHATLSRH
jgi:hypothetical protein